MIYHTNDIMSRYKILVSIMGYTRIVQTFIALLQEQIRPETAQPLFLVY